jgi:hypothetical protein
VKVDGCRSTEPRRGITRAYPIKFSFKALAIAVSDPTRSLADPDALDRSTNSGALVSLQAAAKRLCSKCSSALGRSSDYSTGSSAVDSRHSTCSGEPGRSPVDSKRSSAERELKWIR